MFIVIFSRQTGFSGASIRVVIKPMVISEPAAPCKTKMVARSAILGLGSRAYPGNMQRILNKYLTRLLQSFSRTPKSSKQKKGSASRASRRQRAMKIASVASLP